MNLNDLILAANNLSDDFLPDNEVKEFVNDAISAINIAVDAEFPFLDSPTDEPMIPEKWQRMLIIPFVKGRIKEKDSSQFEWESGYSQYYINLELFKKDYEVPNEYKKDQRSEIVKMVDRLTKNKLSVADTLSFINDGISAVNTAVGATFPHLVSTGDVTAIPIDWQRLLIVQFAVSRVREREGDTRGWEVAYNQFRVNLEEFKDTYIIPAEYKEERSDLVSQIITLSDKRLRVSEVLSFINDAISSINIETESMFPLLNNQNDEPAITEEWQRMLIIPFAKARMKEKGSSQYEWETAYNQYYRNLELFKKYYNIPDIYKKDQRSDIIKMVDLLSNNKLSAADTLNFINDGIAAINTAVDASFPYITTVGDVTAIPMDWQRMLLVPYAKAKIKEMEGSTAEFEVAYNQFSMNLGTFRNMYDIPVEYQNGMRSKLVESIISLSNKRLRVSNVLEFINDAISAINIETNSNYPTLNSAHDEPKIPEKWQRMLIIPYAKARMKEKDSSQYEWESGYGQFYTNLLEFKLRYSVPDEYKDENAIDGVSKDNILSNVPYLWGGW